MAPIAIIDPEKSRWLFIIANAIAILVALYLLLRLFDLTIELHRGARSCCWPRSPRRPSPTPWSSPTSTVCVLLGEMAFLAVADAAQGPVGRCRDRHDVRGQTDPRPTAAAAAGARTVEGVHHRDSASRSILTVVAWPLSADPMDFVRRTRAVPDGIARLLQQRDRRQRRVLRPARLADPGPCAASSPPSCSSRCGCSTATTATTSCSSSPPRPALLLTASFLLRLAGPDVLLDDAVPAPDVGGAARTR